MVGLQLRHRNHDVGVQHIDRQGELVEIHITASQRDDSHIRMIEIERIADADPSVISVEAGCNQQILDVAAMTRPFANHDLACAVSQKRIGSAGDDRRMRIDDRAALYSTRFGLRST